MAPMYIPLAIFLFFYWKKEGSLPFPVGIFGHPLFAVLGLPEPQAPTPAPPTPVTPPTPCNCPVSPPCPVNPPTPVNPSHPSYKELAKQKIGEIPVEVQWQTTIGMPGGLVNNYTLKEQTTIGDLPGDVKALHEAQAIAQSKGVQAHIDEGSLKMTRLIDPILSPDALHNVKAFGLKELGYNGPNAQYIPRSNE